MADAVVTNLFKYVAVRPIQFADERRLGRAIVRDARLQKPDGLERLRTLSRELGSPDAARRRWNTLDLTDVRGAADRYGDLVDAYRSLARSERLGADRLDPLLRGIDARTNEAAWDALYVADRTGRDAGPRLREPLAALRVLNFLDLRAYEPDPERDTALEALEAVPVVSPVLHEFTAQTPDAATTPPRESPTQREQRIRQLAREVESTERLLQEVGKGRPQPAMDLGASEQGPGGWTRAQLSVTTAPPLSDVVAHRLKGHDGAMLDRLQVPLSAPVTQAVRTLSAHLDTLQQLSAGLEDDPTFTTALREYRFQNNPLFVEPRFGIGGLEFDHVDPNSAPDVDVGGRIEPLGIGDLKVVKQQLLAYEPGEVAHIENVLRGESKERTHRKLDRTETTVFTSDERTDETERDTQTTERYELKREVESTVKEDLSVKAGLTVTAAFGPVVTTATGEFAYATAKQDAMKSSSNYARELVDRSVSKVQTKAKVERTTKTFGEVEEINKHGLDNTSPGTEHIVGVYRWVDKRFRAQVYNYGRRLLMEFIVPEPAAFYRAAQRRDRAAELGLTPPVPPESSPGVPLRPADLLPLTYSKYVTRYQVSGVTPPPPQFTFVGTSLSKEGLELGKTIAASTKEFTIPEGYVLTYYSATVTVLWKNYPEFTLQVGRDGYVLLNYNPTPALAMSHWRPGMPDEIHTMTGSVPVSIAGYDVVAYAVNVQGLCERTEEKLRTWQHLTYDKIVAAYQALKTAYDQKLAQADASEGIRIEGRNPATNRVIEQTELRKHCITMMTGQHFSTFDAMTDPSNAPARFPEVDVLEALRDGPIVQFFEQAFEWEQMTYLFYPYFWGRKRNWVSVGALTSTDPLFERFLTAGAARVVVPVPLAYVPAVLYLLQSKATSLADKVWLGGERPTLDDPLYVSLVDELRSQTDDLEGATPEGEPWEFTLPTTLVWLQPGPELPVFAT